MIFLLYGFIGVLIGSIIGQILGIIMAEIMFKVERLWKEKDYKRDIRCIGDIGLEYLPR